MIRIMSWTDSIVCPIQQYFNHNRTMIVGKYDWFCGMKCRSDSERSMRAFRSLERHLCVQETHAFYSAHIKPNYFASLMNWDYFHLHLFSYLNASQFELIYFLPQVHNNWAASSEFVSSSILSWQISTAHAQPFSGARDLAFCMKVPLDSLLVWASSGGSGETARMRRLAWTFAARIGDKYQIPLTRSNLWKCDAITLHFE